MPFEASCTTLQVRREEMNGTKKGSRSAASKGVGRACGALDKRERTERILGTRGWRSVRDAAMKGEPDAVAVLLLGVHI